MNLLLFHNKKETLGALFWSFCFCFVNFTCSYFEKSASIHIDDVIFSLINALIFSPLVGEVVLRIKSCILCKNMRGGGIYSPHRIKYFLFVFLFLSLAYTLIFLAYYPGLFAYDVMVQLPQYYVGYSTHHPLLHTLYLIFFYYIVGENLGDYTLGIACSSIIQMLIFAAMLSYIHLFLLDQGVKKRNRMFLIILTGFLPFLSVLSVSTTKDTFFAGFVGVFSVGLFYWEKQPSFFLKKINIFVHILSIIGIILFRNNGIYAIAAAFIGGLVILNGNRIKFIIILLTGIIIAFMISKLTATFLLATPGSKNEMYSIPYQQIAFTYNIEKSELSEDLKADIEIILPNVKNYNLHLSDPVKQTATGNDNIDLFIKIYFELLKAHPLDYIQAFIQNNIGYFYINDKSFAMIYGNSAEWRQGYLLTDTKSGFDVIHKSYIPVIENLYEYLYTINKYYDAYILRYLCSPATYFWLFTLIGFLSFKKQGCIILSTFVCTYIVTLLAGPCVLIRYAVPYIICMPALIMGLLRPSVNN